MRSVVILTKSEPMEIFGEVKAGMEREYPGRFPMSVYECGLLDEDEELRLQSLEELRRADFVVMYLHGTVTSFKHFPEYLALLGRQRLFFCTGMEEENREMAGYMNLSPDQYRIIGRYYANGDEKNLRNLFLYATDQVTGSGSYSYDPPDLPKLQGIFDGRGRTEDKDEQDYIEKIEKTDRPVIGILFRWSSYVKGDTAHVRAVMEEVRRLGAEPYCVYSQITPDEEQSFKGVKETFSRYFLSGKKVLIGALLNLTEFSVSVLANPGNGSSAQDTSVFEMLGVPVFQVMTTTYSFEEWEEAPAGIHPQTLPYHVFQPEFDGQIITWPAAYTEKVRGDQEERSRACPIPERVQKVCRLAYRWALLARLPMKEKKIAFLFHNIPPRNDTIGCASGLDSPESVYMMVEALKREGFVLDYDFRNGQEIIQKIIDGVTNDGRWSTEEQLAKKSAARIDREKYRRWFDSFTEKVQKELIHDWGQPPGEYMTACGDLLVPGILNGNLFIGLQPPRGLIELAEELLHNTDVVCPHQYLAFYRWIEEVFEADAVVHVGTHGTLEWLPGREVGLDASSYPDVAIGTLPNLYPYLISNPGEGVQAKRRGSCVILDHMIPSFTESGLYEELADLDGLLKDYYHFMLADRSRVPQIAGQIWEMAVQMHLDGDLELTEEDAQKDLAGCIDKIHAWTSRIQSHEIKDGLHIYGQKPKGEQLRNMMRVLLRVSNGDVLSLRESLCRAAGVSMDEILKNPAQLRPDGRTNAMLREDLDECGRRIFARWEETGYQKERIEELISGETALSGGDFGSLRRTLIFAADEVKPRLEETEKELGAFLDGFSGRLVRPGLSGCPTRGNVHLLPTGRNFYTVDPSAIPSRAAWTAGKMLGDQLLGRCEKEEGKLPENVTILVYATEAMRTTGDDIAEILYLFGLRPVWLGSSDRVIGMEVIPLEELKRPRIDVTLRITGLMRDTFPNLIERIEDAVNLVASLDEPYEQNYIRKHIEQETAEFLRQGLEREQAFERASLRIFGDPPGTYGAGVKELVYAKKWDTSSDLGEIFTAWGCHAYGKKFHGEKRYDDFARRLSRTDVSVKNDSNIESDMLASDDFYNYFGGLACAVNTHSGQKKPVYLSNTADKDRPENASLHEEASRIMRARVNNPRWIEGLKRHGYRGAQEISAMVDIVFGWDATTSVIDDWMYKAIADRYAFDKENAEWIRDVNLYAMQNIAERLLEASARGMWNASEEDLKRLREIYMDVEGDIEGLNE